jgi:transposase
MAYVGIDVHRKQSHLAALGEDGQVVLSQRVRTRPEEFLRVFGELEREPIEVAFESTFGWGWLADLLADAGIPAHMAHPLATKGHRGRAGQERRRRRPDPGPPAPGPTCSPKPGWLLQKLERPGGWRGCGHP